ncbi:hypothetical protein ACIQOF_21485 [Streptomyces sp. NPDC091265]
MGSAFALLIVVVEEHAGTPFGEGQLGRNAYQASASSPATPSRPW